MKQIISGLVIVATAAAFSAPAVAAGPTPTGQSLSFDADSLLGLPTLKIRSAVLAEYVTLGDIFENAGAYKDTIVFKAPQPGERSLFSIGQIRQAVKSTDLPWAGKTPRKHIIVERTGRKVPMREILAIITERLQDEGFEDDIRLKPRNRNVSVYTPVRGYDFIDVENMDVDKESGRVEAHLIVSAKGMEDKRFRVEGKIIEVAEVPSLNHRIAKSDIIMESDIEWISVERRRLQDGTATSLSDLIGMSPTRTIRPGKPIRLRDIGYPVMIPKGEVVTIALDTPGLSLKALGRALDDGSKGEIIRVLNLQSDQTIMARVISPDYVRINMSLKTALAAF